MTKPFVVVISVLFLIAVSGVFKGVAMPFFKKVEEEVVVCSPMEGIITYKGEPVVGAKVERWLNWKDDVGEYDFVLTDDDGKFVLPIKKDIVKLSSIATFVMGQEIKVKYGNNEYLIWSIGKESRDVYGELGHKPVNFRCELMDDGEPYRLKNALLFTSCKWD